METGNNMDELSFCNKWHLAIRIEINEVRINEGAIKDTDNIYECKEVRRLLEFIACRLHRQEEEKCEIPQEMTVGRKRVVQMLSIIQICRDKRNQHSCKQPPHRLQFPGNSGLECEAHVPYEYIDQQKQVGHHIHIVSYQRLEKIYVHESARNYHQQQYFNAEVHAIAFIIKGQVHGL